MSTKPADTETDAAPEIPSGFELYGYDVENFVDQIAPLYWRKHDAGADFFLPVLKRHTNPLGIVHGGVEMTMLDICLGATAGVVVGHRGVYPTVNLNISFMAAAGEGEALLAQAEVTKITRSLAFVTGRISAGDRVLATATGVYKNPKPPEKKD